MFKSFGLFWKNYFNFKGISKRSEFWWMYLINTLYFLIFLVAFGGIGLIFGAKGLGVGAIIGIALSAIYAVAAIIPSISLLFRRYRDAGVTPWWLLLTVVLPIVLQATDFYNKMSWLRTIVFVIEVINIVILVLPSKNKD